jgi:hypothetical protein
MDKDKQKFCQWVYSLFCVAERRRALVAYWHCSPPNNGSTLTDIFSGFIKTILYAPLRLTMSNTGVSLFNNEELPIAYSWLTSSEKTYVASIFLRRHELFDGVEHFLSSRFRLHGFKYNDQAALLIATRRAIVRDFTAIASGNPACSYALVAAYQRLMLQKRTVDRFVYEAHHALVTPGCQVARVPVLDY